MHKEFWLERWEKEETGFHEGVVNTYLNRYWQDLQLANDSVVFVPLCGKSVDMRWLQGRGHKVVGVEVSEIAVHAFFKENACIPDQTDFREFRKFEADNICILCGDFFDLCREDMANVSAVYDRASMIALPPVMRERYVRHLVGILPSRTRILLVALDYPQAEMSGPPFALPAAEVEALYGKYADIRILSQVDALPQNPRFQARGLTRMQESAYLLTLR